MSSFYRYLRPVQFNIKTHAPEAMATGGVGFKVIDFRNCSADPDAQRFEIEASVAVCSNEVVFNKTVSRNILDGREKSKITLRFIADGLDAESLAIGFIKSVDRRGVTGSNDYMVSSADRYADSIEWILKTHKRANTLSLMSRDIVEALDIKNEYA